MSAVRVIRTVTAAAVAAATAGCGLAAPAPPAPAPSASASAPPASAPPPLSGSRSARQPAAPAPPVLPPAVLAQANRTHEVPSRRRPAAIVAGYWSTPAGALDAFASAYVNWTAADVVQKLRALAAVSLGPARSEMQMEQARAAADRSLSRSSVADTGVVEAVTRLTGGAGLWLVVTRELTSSGSGGSFTGGTAGWHVTLARVTRLARREWVVSAWQPES